MDQWTAVSYFISMANHMRTFQNTPTSAAEAKMLKQMIEFYDELACLVAPDAL